MRGLLLALLVACSAPAKREVTYYHFQEGTPLICKVDGRVTLRIDVHDGSLFVNGENTGPYRVGAPVQFVSDREMIVDGERRAIP
jgi:hypothetical protein